MFEGGTSRSRTGIRADLGTFAPFTRLPGVLFSVPSADRRRGRIVDSSDDQFLGGLPFVYPDPLFEVRCIDGAAFLYFSQVAAPLPAQPVSDYSEWGADLFDLVLQRQPPWAEAFLMLWNIWQQEISDVKRTLDTLSPLRDRIQLVGLAYPADSQALDRSKELIREANYTSERILSEVASPGGAAGEFMKHILLEEWLIRDNDLDQLYDYCNQIFLAPYRIKTMLAEAYLLRCTILRYDLEVTILLNNPRLVPFLGHLRSNLDLPGSSDGVPRNVISWELFRQILMPYLEPITDIGAEKIAECLDGRPEDITALKHQCARLSDRLIQIPNIDQMQEEVARFIRLYVEEDISNLLQIGGAARRDIIHRVLADKVAWAGTLSFIYGVAHAMPTVSVAGAIGALAFIGSNVSQSVVDYRRQMQTSSYRLVYRLAH